MVERFQDHFSTQANAYARFRPHYPDALFDYLARLAPVRNLAWDCGTGNGQAAVALAERFERVVGSDASEQQLVHATPHPKVRYVRAVAEEPPVEVHGADLVTVAQAVHWFDHARFYAALRRILKPTGVFAAWGYGLMHVTPVVDALVLDYYSHVVGPYWPPDRRHLETGYRRIPFPLVEIAPPAFAMTADWDLETLLGYLDTWSATQRYIKDKGEHPLAPLRAAFETAWGGAQQRGVTWPLFLRVGRFA